MLTRRALRRAPYRAYKVAWKERQDTVNGSPALLISAFERAAVGQEHRTTARVEGRFWLQAWADEVPPQRLKWRLFRLGFSPYWEVWRILRDALGDSDRLPKARRIPNRFELISEDGWDLGNVALVPVGSFEPAADVGKVLGDCRWTDTGEKKYRELPVWLRVLASDGPVDVMSGEDCIGQILADTEYLARIFKAREHRRDLVPDGSVLARFDGQEIKLKKLKIHVYTRLGKA